MFSRHGILPLIAALMLIAATLPGDLAMRTAHAGQSGTVKKIGNWKSSGRITGQRPRFRRRSRGRDAERIDFYGMRDPWRERWSRRPADARRPPYPERPGFFGLIFGPGRSGHPAPGLIAPDAPVVEYVEKPKIHVYPTPRLLPLQAMDLDGGDVSTPMAGAIRDVLRTGAARVEVEPAHRRAIIAFYKARGFAPAWIAGADVSARGQAVLALLARAHEHGLKPEHYRVPVVWEHDGDASAITGNNFNLARLDVELTAMALRYARHISGGVVDPNRLSSYHDLSPPKISAPAALKKLAEAPDVAAWLGSLAPTHFAYGLMKRELMRLRNAPPQKLLPPIPVGRLIRPGDRDERLPLIRLHLKRQGLISTAGVQAGNDAITLQPTAAEVDSTGGFGMSGMTGGMSGMSPGSKALPRTTASPLYDRQLEQAVRKFQKMAGLKPDGLIGKGTIAALNRRNSRDTRKARMEKLALNMERLRWMPRDFGNPHFLVNVPAFEVYMYENGRQVWKSRVITGKPKNQTAFFSDYIEYVVFNPYWGVPQSIIRKEFIPKLMKDPYWLDREGYEVRDANGRVISSASVDWARWRYAKHIPFDIRQLPGDRNALGRIKVLFPNKHAIYMHDTPFKSLFRHRKRAFSHGCVRVQKPVELAELVSGLDPYEIEENLKSGRNRQMKLPRRIRVHIAYFTVWPDNTGRLHFYEDVYGRDRLLKIALAKHDAAYRRQPEPRLGMR